MLIETLQQYGLTEKESKVYLAGLSLGSAPGSTIARHAGENRVTVYSILKELVKKGIFTALERGDIKYFSPISPEILVRNQEDKYNTLKEKLPELMALIDKSNNKPKVQFFEGIEGVKTAYKKLIIEGYDSYDNAFYTFVGAEKIDNQLNTRFKNDFIPWRLTFEKPTYAIISTGDDPYATYNKSQHSSIIVNNNFFMFSNELIIYGENKIAIIMYSSDEMTAMLIQSQTLYNALKGMFLYIWHVNKGKKIK